MKLIPRLFVLPVATSIILIANLACGVAAKRAVSESLRNDNCKFGFEIKIDWEEGPTLTADGYLILSGRAKEGARLHQAQEQVASMVGTDLVAAFVPTIVLSRVDEELHTLVPIALIWPPDMADQLEPRGDVLNLFGQRDTYVVTDDFVDIKIQLPFHIQDQDGRLAVEIWPTMTHIDPDTTSLGAECVKREK